jgi:hypothetical protein
VFVLLLLILVDYTFAVPTIHCGQTAMVSMSSMERGEQTPLLPTVMATATSAPASTQPDLVTTLPPSAVIKEKAVTGFAIVGCTYNVAARRGEFTGTV